MVALSLSISISGSSAFTVSPGFTKTVITGTSLKSPMSGTLTSICAILGSFQSTSRRTSPSRCLSVAQNRAASAPSIARWS